MLRTFLYIAFLAAAALTFPPLNWTAAHAEEGTPSVEDIVKALTPPERTRSFITRGISGISPGSIPADEPKKVVVSDNKVFCFFALNSAELTPSGLEMLEKYVSAFKSRSLRPYTFLISGHASRDGAESFKLTLSKRRAEAAQKYIVERGVEPDRVKIAWFGSRKLKNAADAYSPENRRLEIINCGTEADRIKQCEEEIESSRASEH